jgi:ornithine--oxo-acid transaminase
MIGRTRETDEGLMAVDVAGLFAEREGDRYALHTRYLNEQMVRVLRTVGFDRQYQRGSGQYLYDAEGEQYLDLLSGWGVFALGRNHPAMREALKGVLDAELPNLVQLDLSALAGVLAERLLHRIPYLEKVFFANSGTETVEAALKFARAATGRLSIVYCSARVSRVELWGAVGKRGPGFPLRFWAAAAELRRSAIQ